MTDERAVTIKIDLEVWQQIKSRAPLNHLSVKALVDKIFREYLEQTK